MNDTGFRPVITRITPHATFADLRLTEPKMQVLRDVATLANQNRTSSGQRGHEGRVSQRLGIMALFIAGSRIGRAMAAEALAHELDIPLYHVDLSAVVSKNIGETEKNLLRVFDAAEEGDAVLLFDEADALFGRRSEVKDSHDRYANIETRYLLQRMEKFRGLSILSGVLPAEPDPRILRMFRFAVSFPAPVSSPGCGADRTVMIHKAGSGRPRKNGKMNLPVATGAAGDVTARFERNRYFTGKYLNVSDEGEEQGTGDDDGGSRQHFERNQYFYGKLMTVCDFSTEQEYVSTKGWLMDRLLSGTIAIAGADSYAMDARISVKSCCRNILCRHLPAPCRERPMKCGLCKTLAVTGELVDPESLVRLLQLRGCIRLRGFGYSYDGAWLVERTAYGIREGRWMLRIDLLSSGPTDKPGISKTDSEREVPGCVL